MSDALVGVAQRGSYPHEGVKLSLERFGRSTFEAGSNIRPDSKGYSDRLNIHYP